MVYKWCSNLNSYHKNFRKILFGFHNNKSNYLSDYHGKYIYSNLFQKMLRIINTIDKKFKSKQLESQFFEQQMPGILEYHKLVTILLSLFYAFLIILSMFRKDFTMAPIMFTLLFVNIIQYLYFKKRPSKKCLAIINIYNIGIAFVRLNLAF